MAQTDLDIESLRRALSDRVVGCQIFYHDSLGSTMDEARRLADQGEPEGAVVVTEEQTKGRGRFERAWISPPGQDLLFAVLLKPSVAQLPYVNMAATLAVSRAVAETTASPSSIKWPNDVLVSGRKLSGILVEAAMEAGEVRHAIVGIGVNVNLDPARFPEIASTATSIFKETGQKMDRTRMLYTILEQLDDLYRAVKAGRSLTEDWAALLETLGRTVRIQWQSQVLEGRAEVVDDRGNLILVYPDGSTFTAVAGEVTLQI